jgi:aspartyl-tRNA synthetase
MERTYIKNLKDLAGKEVTIKGWVDVRRDHGKLIFIDLRDVSGKVQMVVLPNHKEAQASAKDARNEWVLEIKGKVNTRPEKMVKKDEPNGAVEIEVLEVKVLGKAAEIPFELGSDVNIDTYLDHLP